MPVEPIAGASSSAERKDPWSSTYLEKRLRPAASAGGVGASARPTSAYVPSTTFGTQDELSDIRMHRPGDRPLTGSPKMRSGLSGHGVAGDNQRYVDPQPTLGVPRQIRDATAGTRPTSMYAGALLDSQVQSAIQRSVAPQQPRSARMTPPKQQQQQHQQPEKQLKSKWSQYFTSTAAASPQASLAAGANNRGRSESLSSTNVGGMRDNSNSALYGARVLSKQNGSGLGAAASPPSRPFASSHRPISSDGGGQTRSSIYGAVDPSPARRLGVSSQHQQQQPPGISRNYELASPRSISSVSNEPRNVMSSFDTRKPSGVFASSPLLSSNIRSRSATLPELHVGEPRPCTTCGIVLRPEEQRQFASKQGIVYCTDCYHSSYSRGHCAGCNKIVLTHGRPWVQYGDKVWHKLCIKCRTCSKLLMAPLVDLDGMPTCEPCFMRTNPKDAPRPMPSNPPADVPPRSRIDPPIPSAIGGSTRPVASVDLNALEQGAKQAAASIPTPVISEYEHINSNYNSPDLESMSGKFSAMNMDAMRIMSPVEVAEKEGLPLPRGIVDPDIGAISRSENQPTATELRRSSVGQQTARADLSRAVGNPTHSRTASASSAKVDAIKSMLTQSVTPLDTSFGSGYRPQLSPSLKKFDSPSSRNSPTRSVSFRFDQTTVHDAVMDDNEEEEEEEEEEYGDDIDNTQEMSPVPAPRPEPQQYEEEEVVEVQVDDEVVEEPAKSLAEYVLSKASTAKSKVRLPSVADAIKKFSGNGFGGAPASKNSARNSSTGSTSGPKESVDKSQIPGIQDLVRTHQRKPPTEPTIPALDKHSRILKSRPRNNNRRGPSQSSAAIQQDVNALRREEEYQQQQQSEEEQPQQSLAPNQCARCTNNIEDTWFRLSDGRQVHVECFTCQGCDKLIDDGVYVLENGIEFHPACVPPSPPVVSVSPVPSTSSSNNRVRGPRDIRREESCDRCHAVLSGPRFQLTNGKQYHPECFACAGCGQRFDEGSYVCFEGQEYHHHCVEKFANNQQLSANEPDVLICLECDQPIEGVFLRHNDAAFHPNCFCCCDCQRAITPGMPFGEIENHPCCESCLEQRASNAAAQQQQQQQQRQQQQRQQQQQQQHQNKQNAWANNRPQQYYPTKTGY
ncbi:LIM and senescent cell antigen-like-containing domain protein 2 [Coemansia sp. IMI 203386]|nr:LIM and senescent cell antigen-like-containing domain protein 2 [Coemansia sp. IMI 203386]